MIKIPKNIKLCSKCKSDEYYVRRINMNTCQLRCSKCISLMCYLNQDEIDTIRTIQKIDLSQLTD